MTKEQLEALNELLCEIAYLLQGKYEKSAIGWLYYKFSKTLPISPGPCPECEDGKYVFRRGFPNGKFVFTRGFPNGNVQQRIPCPKCGRKP